MKQILYLFLLLFSISAFGQLKYEDYFEENTLRIDYFHSGNHVNEYVVVDKIITEGPWSGLKTSLIDIFDYGHHRILVYDSASNKLIFSRGFSSLFNEYRNSPQAKEQCGNFSETFTMPKPKKSIYIEFSTRDKKNEWQIIKTFYVNMQNDITVYENPYRFDVEKIKYNGAPSEKLDIAFIAEGYTKDEMEKFIKDCNRLAGALFSIEPYKKLSKKINIWAVKSVSDESDVSVPTENIYKTTVLNASYNTLELERYLMVTEHHVMRDVASNAPYDQIYVIANSKTYGGGGIYNFLSIGTADNIMAFFLLWHEFGHALAGLADEYVSDDAAFQNLYTADVEPWEPNITTLFNFEDKWQMHVKKNVTVPTPYDSVKDDVVGVFEGAGYTAKGVYRPMKDCIMRSANLKKYCTICEYAIEKAISFYAQ